MTSFLIDPSLLLVKAGRQWVQRARGKFDLCTPNLSGRPNEVELLQPFQSDRLRHHASQAPYVDDDVSWIPPVVGTDVFTSLDLQSLVDRCRDAIAVGAILVARRPALIDGLLSRGERITVLGQPAFDDALDRIAIKLGEHLRPLLYALFRPKRCRYALFGGPSLDLLPSAAHTHHSELILLDRGPLWGGGRPMARPSIVDVR